MDMRGRTQTADSPKEASIGTCLNAYDSLLDRFSSRLNMLQDLADRIHGTQPTPVLHGGQSTAAMPSPPRIRQFQDANGGFDSLLTRFDDIMNRIDAGI